MSSVKIDSWKKELVNKFFGAGHDVDKNEGSVLDDIVEDDSTVGDYDNNNSTTEGCKEAAAEIMKEVVSSVFKLETNTGHGSLQDDMIKQGVPIDDGRVIQPKTMERNLFIPNVAT